MRKVKSDKAVFPFLSPRERTLPFLLWGAGCLGSQYPIARPEGFPYYQLLLFQDGEGIFTEGDRYERILPGRALFLYPDTIHSYHAETEPWPVLWIMLGGHEIAETARLAGIHRSEVLTVDEERISALIWRAIDLGESERPFPGPDTAEIALGLMMELLRASISEAREGGGLSRLTPVLEFMATEYRRDIPLEELAQLIGVSAPHLCRLFRHILHQRPMEYLNNIRIEKAKELLRTTPLTVGEVAGETGFHSVVYFRSVFRAFEGTAPSLYREMYATPSAGC